MGHLKVPAVFMIVATVLSLAGSVTVHTSDSKKFEPMVAFLCNKPSMVRVPAGWMHDDKQNCTGNVEDILKFCRKKYPNHAISNVVSSHVPVTINNWCVSDAKTCRHGSHTVKPFRCLVGPFQSSALLVPEHCVFDHYHDSKVCANEKHWNDTSFKRCKLKSMVRQSYDILLPCPTTNEFSGVEYVCCPHANVKPRVSINIHVEPAHSAPSKAKTHLPTKKLSESQHAYMKYLHEVSLKKGASEHEDYEIARRDWQRFHHSKITNLIKEWSAARDRVVQLNATDPKLAKKLNTEIGQKFQKIYHALEEEGVAEKQQLNTVHQNHVQRKLNENKRTTMQRFMDELQRDQPQAAKLLKSLEQYIRVEEKDRRHTVNHYEHMRDVNPAEAKRILSATIDHLKWIDKRILQSVKMLHRFPKIESHLKPEIERFLRRFSGIAASATSIVKPVGDEQRKVVEDHRAKEKTTPQKQIKKTEHKTVKKVLKQADEPVTVKINKAPIIEEVIVKDKKDAKSNKPKKFDPETMENEHKYFNDNTDHFVAHQTDSRMHQNDSPIHKEAVRAGGAYGVTIGIAIGSVSIFVVIIVAVVMLRKRSRKPMITHGFVEVDQAISPEERHVANMQINGYENPTYKYFEK